MSAGKSSNDGGGNVADVESSRSGGQEGESSRDAGESRTVNTSMGQRGTPSQKSAQKPNKRRGNQAWQARCEKTALSKRLSHSRAVLKTLRRRYTLVKRLCAKEWNVATSGRVKFKLFSQRELDDMERFKHRLNPDKHRISKSRSKSSKSSADDNEVLFKSSNVFLKGTQSANPHNDYSQHFVDTGQRPQNFIRDAGLGERFEEYPKLKELIRLKDEQIRKGATPPVYLKNDLKSLDMTSFGCKFDVILIEPPLEEYQRKTSGISYDWEPWDFEEIMNLKIEEVAAPRSFMFLWCGSYEGLDLGRECLKKWGFRRCEDICWVKTNINNPGNTAYLEPKSVFQHTKEHCLMGIKGTVRRNQDGHFIHANIDLDIIITEEPELGNIDKPEEIFHIIEHFCLGRRRLHLFGNDATVRPGWLTVGPRLSSSNYHKETYLSFFEGENGFLLPKDETIENLRPKTPPPKGRGVGRGGTPIGSGRGGPLGRGGPIGRGSSLGRGTSVGRGFPL